MAGTVAERVARLRAAHGESLRDAAARTKVSYSTISRIERGEVTGSFSRTLAKIADGYGVDAHYLLTGEESVETLRLHTPEDRARLYLTAIADETDLPPEQIRACAELLLRAIRSGVEPGMLHLAIDLLAAGAGARTTQKRAG